MNIERLLIVVPALNECESISEVVRDLRALALDVLVVDDGSSDDTAERAETEGARVLRLPINLGVGGALRAGFRYAVDHGYSSVVQVDADGQHPAHQIQDLIEAARRHEAHLVIGSRYLSSDATLAPSSSRRLAMKLLGALVSRASGCRITDSTSGFRIIREPLLSEFSREFPAYYLGDTYEATILAARAGFRIAEIPAALSIRKHGTSSSGRINSLSLLAKVLAVTLLRLNPPLRT